MTELSEMATKPWSAILYVALIFGFAPGFLLRFITLAYWKDDPRRAELRAEFHAVPLWRRPIWVAEQVEVALIEGLGSRLRWAATGRLIDRWHVTSGVELNRQHPESFWIPPADERDAVRIGDVVKLGFQLSSGSGERMWVRVTHDHGRKLWGTLDCQPVVIPKLFADDLIKFTRNDIIDIWSLDEMGGEHTCGGTGDPQEPAPPG